MAPLLGGGGNCAANPIVIEIIIAAVIRSLNDIFSVFATSLNLPYCFANLQDPPSFSIAPEEQYRQEAGRTLLIPCQGNKDSTMKVTWSKVNCPVQVIQEAVCFVLYYCNPLTIVET